MSRSQHRISPPRRRTSTDAAAASAPRTAPRKRVTPFDAFLLARSKWLSGERIDIGQLAGELGVSRATVFRWVGSREQLYGEILSGAYRRVARKAQRDAQGRGAERAADIMRRTMHILLGSAALRTFIEQDPEFAIRVLTSKSSPVQARTIQVEIEILSELVQKGEIDPALDIETLAYIIVRIGESFVYGDVISGHRPDVEKAVAAIRILVAAQPPTPPSQ